MQVNACTAPADSREEAYRLLAERAPARVIVDTDLPDGTWAVVRAPYEWERERLLAMEATTRG